jgi:ferredoxin-type protein NapH
MSETPESSAATASGWWRAHKWLVLRRTSQFSILGMFLLGPWTGTWIAKGTLASSLWLDILPITDPLIALQSFAAKQSLELTALIGAVIVTGLYLVVGGRAYCSWVCPINVVTDTAHWAHERLGPQAGGRLKRNTRLWILGLILVLSAATGTIVWEFVNPITMLYRGLLYGMGFAWVIVAGIFLLDFITRHTWCGHLCPVGAFYGLLGKVSVVRVSAKHRDRCTECKDCLSVCPERHVITAPLTGAESGVGPIILSGDCTNCGRCIDVCPEGVFSFSTRFHNGLQEKKESPAVAAAAE